MTISALPTPPSRAAAPDTFASQADALLGALPVFVTEANALQADVNAKQVTASTAATTAITQVGIATTKAGEASADAADADAARIAAESARNAAAGYRDNAALSAGQAALSAGQAAAAALSASNAADTCAGLVAGISDGPVTSVNGQTGIVTLDIRLPTYTYDARADLRSLTPSDGDQVVVDGLGLFVFFAGSDEPDDDESCFATAAGRWLLEAAHWDVVSMWQLPDDAVRDEYDEDAASKVLSGTATCAITSVAAVSSVSFTGAVTGASVGDRVIATPPAQLGNTAADTGRLSYHAWVSAADTVTVMLTNASAAAANTNTAIRTAWPITVIKGVQP